MFVQRSTYIYHYFATTPFLMLSIVCFFRDFVAYRPQSRLRRTIVIAYAVLCVVLFAMYYPLLTGVPVAASYAQYLRILPGWVLYAYWL